MVMRFGSGNLRANMMIYKEAGSKDTNHIVLDTEGVIGSYNRANRSLTHFTENSLPIVLCIMLSGRVFAFPTFVLTAVFCGGRVMHQVGYASIGYGAHAPGFLAASLSAAILQGFCLLIAAKNLGFTKIELGQQLHFEL